MLTCGRCGITDRHVKATVAHLEREARQDGHPKPPFPFGHGDRCIDKDACRARVAGRERPT